MSYTAAIGSCGKGIQWKNAFELMARMERRGVTPDVMSYAAAISSCRSGSSGRRLGAASGQWAARGGSRRRELQRRDQFLRNQAPGFQWANALELLAVSAEVRCSKSREPQRSPSEEEEPPSEEWERSSGRTPSSC